MSTDPKNEKFTAFEFGINSRSNDGTMAAKFNLYSTTWSDRIATRTVENIDGDEDIIYLSGINQNHTGVEFEFSAQINDMFRLDLGAGLEIGFTLKMQRALTGIVMVNRLTPML